MYMTDPCDHDPTAKNERPSHKARTKAEIFFLPFVDFSLDEVQNMNKPHRYKRYKVE